MNIKLTQAAIITAATRVGISAGDFKIILMDAFMTDYAPRQPRAIKDEEGAKAEILCAIATGTPGFRGGWISSRYVDQLVGDRVPRTGRRDLLARMGYVQHPALPDGRTNNKVSPDNGKPRLYARQDHPALALTRARDVEHAYTAAQMM